MNSPVRPIAISRWHKGRWTEATDDLLAVEEPMEIRLGHGNELHREKTRISVTMRTPGHDFELALGFLFTEGLIHKKEQLMHIAYCKNTKPEEAGHVVNVDLAHDVPINLASLQRNFYTSSSCGVCGKASIESVFVSSHFSLPEPKPIFTPTLLLTLADKLKNEQHIFRHTGGLHAAALFSQDGELLLLREDIGRHNAVDKVIGAALSLGWLPLHNHLLLVSGRAGFELVQKATMARLSGMVAIGAPSSLSVELAMRTNMLLAGFIREDRFNVYAGEGWLAGV